MPLGTFTLDIRKFVEKTKSNVDLVVRKIALDMFKRVIMRSPVDTGRFRGNWQVAIGSIPGDTLELDDKDGTATIAKATAEAMNMRAGQIIYLVNNLPYARRLEFGWSKQAPQGMVRLTVEEYGAAVDKAVSELK